MRSINTFRPWSATAHGTKSRRGTQRLKSIWTPEKEKGSYGKKLGGSECMTRVPRTSTSSGREGEAMTRRRTENGPAMGCRSSIERRRRSRSKGSLGQWETPGTRPGETGGSSLYGFNKYLESGGREAGLTFRTSTSQSWSST